MINGNLKIVTGRDQRLLSHRNVLGNQDVNRKFSNTRSELLQMQRSGTESVLNLAVTPKHKLDAGQCTIPE